MGRPWSLSRPVERRQLRSMLDPNSDRNDLELRAIIGQRLRHPAMRAPQASEAGTCENVSFLIHSGSMAGLEPIPLAFWRSSAGREPVREWLTALSREDKRAIGRDIAKVQYGWPIGLPLCRPLSGGLWEVRSSLPSRREARVFIAFHDGMLIALHAIIKKAQRTPKNDIALARERLKELQSWHARTRM